MTVLAYVEHALPGATVEERLALARELDLALEVAHRPETDLDAVRASGLPVAAVAAWGLHEAHPLHPDPARREAGLAHALATLDLARELGAPRIVVALGFGDACCDAPEASCRAFLRAVAARARELGMRAMVEPLSRRRGPDLARADGVSRLLDEVDEPDALGSLLDTGHLLDDGRDPLAVLASWPHRLDELQLRGPRGAPPVVDDAVRWVAAVTCDVLAVEHRAPIAPAACRALVAALRG